MEKKIGFIGFGNMAQAMVKGWLKTGIVSAKNIYASAAHFDKLLKNTEKYGIHACTNNESLVQECDIIIIAIKPYLIEKVITPIKELFNEKMVICVAAGWSFDKLDNILKASYHISTIPNTPIAVAEGIMITEDKHSFTDEQMQLYKKLFEPVSLIEMIDSHHLSIGGTLAGCTPAYTAMYMEALADAGVKHGLTRSQSYRIAAKMITGTGKLYLEYEEHPGLMKDAVCSPGGTTIKGVASLEKNAFRGAVIEAIDAVEEKGS